MNGVGRLALITLLGKHGLADLLQIRHTGERRNLTEGNAGPGNPTNWTPGSALPSVAFAGVTNASAFPWEPHGMAFYRWPTWQSNEYAVLRMYMS